MNTFELNRPSTEHGAITAVCTEPLTPEQLCDRYAHRVYQFATMVSRGALEADDLAQEALIRAITRLPQYNPARGTIDAWLWRIVVNVARDAGRMASRRQALMQRLQALRSRPAPVQSDPLDGFGDEDLLEAIRALPARDRALIALRFGADLDYVAVGAALGMSPAAAGVATRRALATLRTHLEDRS